MGLRPYNQKRNFRSTPEPAGTRGKSKSKLEFVVQRHKASHLHYDLRLEIDGVMKSWAVPKGPSMNPGDKRLAMMVEDHPMSYNTFHGVIPEGNYGAGIVEIWDKGSYSDADNSTRAEAQKKLRAGLHSGNLKFVLHGKKLKGGFALVKLKSGDGKSWLLIKHKDQFATSAAYNSEEETLKNSPINQWLAQHPAKKKGAKKTSAKKKVIGMPVLPEPRSARKVRSLPGKTRKLQHYISPMLAKDTDQPFSDDEWIYEMKWDGYRAIAEVDGKNVSLYSRNGNTFNTSYPVVVAALQSMKLHAVLDGEVVVIDENGKSDFQRLQYYQTDSNHPMEYRVFDVLSVDGKDVTHLPLLKRKKILQGLLKKNDVVKYSDHIVGRGIDFFKAAQRQDLEGIIAKKADSRYHIGKRSSEWLKIKNHKTADVVIAGFTAPGGSRKHFGALILGAYEGARLVYIGHTGTGFNEKGLAELFRKLKPLATKTSPFDERIKTNTPATWVKPVVVAEVKFTEFTKDGSLRHPVFLRIRDDKKLKEITMSALRPVHKPSLKKASPKKKNAGDDPESESAEEGGNEKEIIFGKDRVKVTNLKKIFWPEEKITKGDVIEYYRSISKYLLPFLKGRPQSLLRTPNGIKGQSFYHKDAGENVPSFVQTKKIHSESGDKDIHYILCNNAATLTYLNNLGCIELNPWHSTIEKLNNPDYVVIDIDPSEGNTFNQVIEVAQTFNEIMKRVKAPCYCKTSGATGIHIYIPTAKQYTYDQLKDFAHIICILAQEQLPSFTTLERNLRKRGNKMIYLDHLQNRKGQTISCVYSLRPRPGAPVSMPLKWTEVKPGLDPLDFNIYNSLKRIEQRKDAFTEVIGKGIDLPGVLKKLGA